MKKTSTSQASRRPTALQLRKEASNREASSSGEASSSSESLNFVLKNKLAAIGFSEIQTESELLNADWNCIKSRYQDTILSALFSTLAGDSLLEKWSKDLDKKDLVCKKLFDANWDILTAGTTIWCKFFTCFKAKVILPTLTEEPTQRQQWCKKLCQADWDAGQWPPLWFRLIDHNGHLGFLMRLLRDDSDSSEVLLDKLLAANPKEKQGSAISLMLFILHHPEQHELLCHLLSHRGEAFFNKLLEENWLIEHNGVSLLSCLFATHNGFILLEKVQSYPEIQTHFIRKLEETPLPERLSSEMNSHLQTFLEQSKACIAAKPPEEQSPHKDIIQCLNMDWKRVIRDYGHSIAYKYTLTGQIANLFEAVKDIPDLEIKLIEKLLDVDWLETVSISGKVKSLAYQLAITNTLPKLFDAALKHPSICEAVRSKVERILPIMEEEEINTSYTLNPSLQKTLFTAGFVFSSEKELLNTDWDSKASLGPYQELSLLYVLVSSKCGTQTLANWLANPEKRELVLKKILASNWSILSSTTLYTGLPLLYFLFTNPICYEILDELFNQKYQTEVVDKIIAAEWGECYLNSPDLIDRTVLFHLLQENQTSLLNEIAKNKNGRTKLRRIVELLELNEPLKASREKLMILLSLPEKFRNTLSKLGLEMINFTDDLLQQDWKQSSPDYPNSSLFFWIAAAYNSEQGGRLLEVSDLMKTVDDQEILFAKILEADFSKAPEDLPSLPFIFWLIHFPDWLNLLVELTKNLEKKDLLLTKLHEMDINHEYRRGESISNVLRKSEQGRELLKQVTDYEENLELHSRLTLTYK